MSIDVKSLRLGNWVRNDENNPVKICGFTPFENEDRSDQEKGCLIIYDEYHESFNLKYKAFICESNDCNGIPLTEEMLLKCGFVDVNSYKDYRLYVDGYDELGIEISIRNGKPSYFCLSDFPLKYEVKYLHQLQNLYYSLTGKELDIKL